MPKTTFFIFMSLLLLFSCKEQIEQAKTKIKEIAPESIEEEVVTPKVLPEDNAKTHLAINLPTGLTIEDSKVIFSEKKTTEGKIINYVDFEASAVYNDDLYALDRNMSFFAVLRNRGWEDELYKGPKAAPYGFLKKVAEAGDMVNLTGSFKWKPENAEAFSKLEIASNSAVKGKPITSYSDKYLLPDSDKAEDAIKQWLDDQNIAKAHRSSVLNAVALGKRYTGTMKLVTGEVQNIKLTITKQHLALKQVHARITFESDPKLSIDFQGTYITEIRTAGKSHINLSKVLNVAMYQTSNDPFFSAIRTFMSREYLPLIIEENKLKGTTLSGKFTFDLTAM